MQFSKKEIVGIGIPYLIGVGTLYLFGYWGTFKVNVLEFISFSDMGKLAIFPLLPSLAFSFIGILFAEFSTSNILPLGGGRSTRIGAFGNKHWRWLVVMLIIIITLCLILNIGLVKWFIIAWLISLFSVPLTHVNLIIEIFPNAKLRSTVLFIFLLIPGMSFAFGRQQASLIISGTSNQFVDIERSKLPLQCDSKNPVDYLGLLGGVYILRESLTGDIVYYKQSENTPLFLSTKH